MGNGRARWRILDEDAAICRGQLLEFIAQQKKRGLSKGNAAIRQTKTALSDAKTRTVRPTSSKGLRKS